MNNLLLQWGLFSFMIGVILSLPLSAVIYGKNTVMTKVFTNVRKLKSAHLEYFTQAFALGFAYLLEYAFKIELSNYLIIPLLYGSILNPTILLLESTPFIIRFGVFRMFYKYLKATSPILLLLSWFVIAYKFLPAYLQILFLAIVILGSLTMFIFISKSKNQVKADQTKLKI